MSNEGIGAEIMLPNGAGGRNLFYPKTDYENIVDAQVDIAGAHNALFRGKDLTAYFESGDMSAAIADGSFKDIYPGDYIIKSVTVDGTTYSNEKWYVAGLDSHLHCGDTETTAHHVVLIASKALQRNVPMNGTDTTAGGYLGSQMWTTRIPKWVTGIKAAFGADHVLKHRDWMSNAVNTTVASGAGCAWTGASSGWAWADVEVNLPNEQMIYGGRTFGSGHDCGTFPCQLPLFAHKKYVGGNDRSWYWLRAVASASGFAVAYGGGFATALGASYADAYGGIRPYFLLR